ncbi:MAG: vancomycin resistance protein, partial [Gorillibacterium sp.]|nr:vancomycin resistance protein [Gorillibacterium sp.]
GATCYYNYIDLQIKNETEHTFQLQLRLTDTHLVGEWRQSSPILHTYRVYETRHWITHEYGTGYVRHNEISRITLNPGGEQVSEELVTVNRAVMMYEPLLSEAGT